MIDAETVIPTTSPAQTLEAIAGFFHAQPPVQAIGIASFGPLDLDPGSPTFGYLKNTPKPGWANTDLAGALSRALNVPAAIDTDVNGAALGELHYGAGQGLESLAYMTAGTGVGIGAILNGRVVAGISHTEMGHMLIPRQPGDETASVCPYHANCLEGLASGTALRSRWGSPETVPAAGLELEAHYLACGITNVLMFLSPQRIIIGGGVLGHDGLLPRIRDAVTRLINGYLEIPSAADYIRGPALGARSGVCGALLLARSAAVH